MKKKVIISIFGLLFLVGGLIVGLNFVKQPQDIRKEAAPASSLSISPSSQIKYPGQSINFTVRLDTGENDVMGVDLKLSFDPSIIQISQVSASSAISNFDTESKNEIDNSTGKIKYVRFTTSASKVINGNFEILNITGSVVDTANSGFSLLSFDSDSIISGLGEGQNVLINTVPGRVDISGLTTTSTPTASPTNTATPTSTATSTPTATATSTSTPTSTATVTSTISSTTTPVSTGGTGVNSEDFPVSGVSLPSIISLSVGTLLILGSLLLLVL